MISSLAENTQASLTETWLKNISQTDRVGPAIEIYCGRAFQEAKTTAAYLGSELVIVSAGLGLLSASTVIPPYNATLSKSSENCISRKVTGSFVASDWWRRVNERTDWGSSIASKVDDPKNELVVITLSSNYVRLVSADLMSIGPTKLRKVRIVGLRSPELLPKKLQSCHVPYDDRFDGPDGENRGTRSDFPQRVTRHFIEHIAASDGPGERSAHIGAVRDYMEGLRHSPTVERRRMADDEILSTIRKHWGDVSGNSARMLRLFRDDLLIACEQKRFSELFNEVKKQALDK